MSISIDKEKLLHILKNFHALTGVRVAVFDEYENEIVAYPKRICDICSYKRNEKGFREKCMKSDADAFYTAKGKQTAHIYQCHYGLTEAVKAIKLGDATLGYMMFGQFFRQGERLKDELPEYVDCNLPILNVERLNAGAEIMSICISHVLDSGLMKFTYADKGARIKEYLQKNYANLITVKELERIFGISHTTINRIFQREEGAGVMQYLNKLRIDISKKLLVETNFSQSEISARIGINDPNYFSRLFQKHNSISPSRYRFQFKRNGID